MQCFPHLALLSRQIASQPFLFLFLLLLPQSVWVIRSDMPVRMAQSNILGTLFYYYTTNMVGVPRSTKKAPLLVRSYYVLASI